MKVGVIGDDFTGSSDIGLMLAEGGMKTVQYVGVPSTSAAGDVDAGIVALKSRSIAPADAVRQSLAALEWLRQQRCEQFVFKYCSTFDSTHQGNIGPVIDALIEALPTTSPVIVCPAFPATGRTIYQGHLFVNDKLLSESGMERHPITPMTDPDLRRWLGYQTRRPIGHLALSALRGGRARDTLLALSAAGRQIVVCDAVDDTDLVTLATAARGFELLTGGSGIAMGLPALHTKQSAVDRLWQGERGPALVLSGSCSKATRDQVVRHGASGGPQLRVDVGELIMRRMDVTIAMQWLVVQSGLPLVYTSADPDEVAAIQARFGAEVAAQAIEAFFAELARDAIKSGVRRLICAGGETSGAVLTALGADALEIGPMIDPGVPALRIAGRNVVLALKSGNFGAPDFFEKAARTMAQP